MENIEEILSKIKYDEKGLVPAIAQDVNTKEVLMLAYMNEESLKKTIESGKATYYSRSRQQLWQKGETSGHFQNIKGIYYDCDADTILLKVEQVGVACHTGAYSCFFSPIVEEERAAGAEILQQIYNVILDRQENPKEGSYTNYLLEKGIDKILKKVGEETAEVIIAAKNEGNEELRYEISDLLYHLMVLSVNKQLELKDIYAELLSRR